ncbi:hypothetical protein FIBSPDRAFT_1042337 [Athelia psychrophila]|uniref:Uncharacterized protein n=1 Tax=Athelia psychrophila TaxID=1759441 RepID=A0A166MTF3_9AGAM|nr:hypothetical protein FIBSPDRAFT_1042337 [Fibularhizoctonia sp. CBS 109695]
MARRSLHAPLCTLHHGITAPSSFPIRLRLREWEQCQRQRCLPSLGPTHLRRLPWAKLTPVLVLSRTESARIQLARKHPQRVSTVLAQPPCFGALLRSPAPTRWNRTAATHARGYPHTRNPRSSRKGAHAGSISLALSCGLDHDRGVHGRRARLLRGGRVAREHGYGEYRHYGCEYGHGGVGGCGVFSWMLLAPVVLVGAVMYAGGWRAGHLFEDQEATHIQLQAPLRTLHITAPFLASPILPLRPSPSLPLTRIWNGSGSSTNGSADADAPFPRPWAKFTLLLLHSSPLRLRPLRRLC